MERIDGPVFDALAGSYLNTISVYNNPKLNSFPFSTLKLFNSLDYFNGWGNAFTEVPASAFKGMNDLTVINLSKNAITSIGSDAFSSFYELKNIYLNDNQMTVLNGSAFNFGYERPAYIDLRGNKIGRISGTFKQFPYATTLERNYFTTLNQEQWEPVFNDFIDNSVPSQIYFSGE